MRKLNYGRNYVSIRCDVYGFRGYDNDNALQRILRIAFGRVAVRHWYSRVLHGLSLGASCSRRSIEVMKSFPPGRFRAVVGALSLALVVCTVSAPTTSFAALAVSQTDSAQQQAATTNFQAQALGTSLTGYPYSLEFYANGSSLSTVGWAFYECADATYVACTLKAKRLDWFPLSGGFTKTAYTMSVATTSFSFNSSKYYFVEIPSGGSYSLYGSASSSSLPLVSPRGFDRNIGSAGGSPTTLSDGDDANVKQMYIRLFTTNNYQVQGVTSIISPTYGSLVSSSDNVHFSFTYYINSLVYNRAGFGLVDNTSGVSIDTSSASSSIISSGASTFDGYLDLVYGHTYTWTPYIYDSTGSNGYLFGSSTVFFVGTNQSLPPQTTVTNPWASSSLGYLPFTTVSGSSSTSTGSISFSSSTSPCRVTILQSDIDGILRTRFPTSYIYDSCLFLSEIANGDGNSSGDAYYQLPTGPLGSHLANGSTSIKIVDRDAISALSPVVYIKTLVKNCLYVITGFVVISSAMTIL